MHERGRSLPMAPCIVFLGSGLCGFAPMGAIGCFAVRHGLYGQGARGRRERGGRDDRALDAAAGAGR